MSLARAMLVLAIIGPSAEAAMYKCRAPEAARTATVIYQDVPCAGGRELRNFDTDPANVSVVPGIVPSPAPRSAAESAPAPRRLAHGAEPERRNASRSTRVDAGERRHISSGMAQGEVIARIGKPNVVSGGRKSKSWVYLPAPGDESTMTTLSMSEGRVIAVQRKVIR